jgi:hypothetical protein
MRVCITGYYPALDREHDELGTQTDTSGSGRDTLSARGNMTIGEPLKDDGRGGPASDEANNILSPMQDRVSAQVDTVFVSAIPPEINGVSVAVAQTGKMGRQC